MSDIDESLDDLGLSALLDLDGGGDDSPEDAGGDLLLDDFPEEAGGETGEDIVADDVFGDPVMSEFDEEGSEVAEDTEGASDDEGEESSKKSSKKGKKKKKKDKEKTRVRVFLFLMFVIVVATGYFGFTLIKAANYLGILVIVAGLSLAIFLLVTNMVKLKLYERVKDRTQKSEVTASEKLDEDMEKCRGRISALDERAAEWAKDHPAGGDEKKK